jgi:hypothetical protein
VRNGAHAILAAGLLVAGCAVAAPINRIEFPVTGVAAPTDIRGVLTREGALTAVATVFTRDLSLPAVGAVIDFLPGERALEAELLAGGYDAAFARDAASRLRAVALHRRVLVNAMAFDASSWTARVGTLAHELVHCLQYELAGGRRGTSDQWIREGLAEWVALEVLQRLGAFGKGAARRFLEDELAASQISRAPRLDEMATFRQWVALAGRHDITPQVQATLAIDLLIARHGLPAVLAYFERFAIREDPESNFAAAFGVSRLDFARQVDAQFGLRRD